MVELDVEVAAMVRGAGQRETELNCLSLVELDAEVAAMVRGAGQR